MEEAEPKDSASTKGSAPGAGLRQCHTSSVTCFYVPHSVLSTSYAVILSNPHKNQWEKELSFPYHK